MPKGLTTIVALAIGGSLGTVLRYLLSEGAKRFANTIPMGTLLVNLLGSFLIGFLIAFFINRQELSESQRSLWITGFLGGLTTFSTFAFESWQLLNTNYLYGILYLISSVAGGILAVIIGFSIAKGLL